MRNCYLVTGCAGFIGSKVAEFLLDAGHAVVGLDNLNDSYDIRLKEWRLSQLKSRHGFELIIGDINDRKRMRMIWEGKGRQAFDGVINLAARAGVRYSVENPWVYIDTNITGTLNLLEFCREFGVIKFVLASSSSLYGKNNPVPFREDAKTDQLLSPYATSKKAAENLCYNYHTLYGMDISVLRYFTVYGPAGRPDMSPFRFVQWISEGKPVSVLGDGKQERDFTFVDDIARGTVAALRPLGYEIINLGCDQPVALSDFIHLVEEIVGTKAKLEFKPAVVADILATWADNRKALEILGWKPQHNLRDGVERLVGWYKDNRDWAMLINT